MFIADLAMIVQTRKQFEHPQKEWINKLGYIHTMNKKNKLVIHTIT